MSKSKVVLKYKGGSFMPGLPARDILESEMPLYGKMALASGLYEEIKPVAKPVKEEVTNVRNKETKVD